MDEIIEKKYMRPTWDEYFMIMAKVASLRSTCLSRPVGAVIVKNNRIISIGYCGSMEGDINCTDNGYCYRRSLGVEDKDKFGYCLSCHAEANAIANAARCNLGSTEGSVIYTTLSPCLNCFKLIINSGIRHIFFEHQYNSVDSQRDSVWDNTIKRSRIKTFAQLPVRNKILLGASEKLVSLTSERQIPSE